MLIQVYRYIKTEENFDIEYSIQINYNKTSTVHVKQYVQKLLTKIPQHGVQWISKGTIVYKTRNRKKKKKKCNIDYSVTQNS